MGLGGPINAPSPFLGASTPSGDKIYSYLYPICQPIKINSSLEMISNRVREGRFYFLQDSEGEMY